MGKHDSAPTYGYVFTSWLNKWVVRVCLFTTACIIVAGATIMARLDADCLDRPTWTWNVFGYTTNVKFSKSCELVK